MSLFELLHLVPALAGFTQYDEDGYPIEDEDWDDDEDEDDDEFDFDFDDEDEDETELESQRACIKRYELSFILQIK